KSSVSLFTKKIQRGAGVKFRKKVKVLGKVQGVGFRYATKVQADKIGNVFGSVQNLPDGSVEIVAEGEETKVDDLIAWCYRGSTMSEVSGVEIMESSEINEVQSKEFKILREGH